jgi:glycosyltransferase involved in cell wall biosynthesis
VSTFLILTPTHNRAGHLKEAIESVRQQSHNEWKHFILDDGSTDATPEILSSLDNDPRIHWWKFDRNKGVNAARNFLLERMLESQESGFIVILDDDDRLEKDALHRFNLAAEAQPEARWFIANCHFPTGGRLSHIRQAKGNEPLCFVRACKLGNRVNGDVGHAFHTSIVGDTRYTTSFKNAEEWWFFAGLAERARMHPLDFHAKTQEYLEDGLTRLKPNKAVRAEVCALKLRRFDRFLNNRDRALLEARLGRHLFVSGRHRQGVRMFGRALRHWPFEYRIYTYAVKALAKTLAGRA